MSPLTGRIFALVVAIATSAVAAAQPGDGRLEIAGFVGGMSLSQDLGVASNIYMTVTGAAASSTFGDLFGLRASWAFSRNLAVAFDFSRGTNPYSFDVDDTEIGAVALPDQLKARRLYYGGSVVAQLPLSMGLVPYGSFGVGLLETTPSSPIGGISSIQTTDWSFGGGVKYWIPPVPWLGVGFDLRYHTASQGLTFPGGTSGPTGTEFTLGGMVRLF
jgi:hypothetical protein